jgi:outer membrane lipoprotein SlyB
MIKTITFFTLIAIMFVGCGTFSLELDSKMTNSIFLENLKPKKIIFLVKTNTAIVDDNIGKLLKQKLEKKNYIFTNNPADATYILRVNTINMAAHKEQNEAKAGAVVGGSTGIVAMAAKGGKNGLAGAVVGAVVGGVFAYVVADGQVRMQVDVKIEEAIDGKMIKHYTRVIAEAKQIHLTPEEGQPLLEEKISTQIAGIFL